MDLYVFATPYQVTWDYYFLSREHTIQFDAWEEKAEFEYVSYYWIALTTSSNCFLVFIPDS